MIVPDDSGVPPRGRRLVATLMVVLGAYVAFGTLVSPFGQGEGWTGLLLAEGLAAAATAVAGVRLLRDRPGAELTGILAIAAWLLVWATLAATVGLTAFANPFTVGTSAFLVISLLVLRRR